MNKAASTPATVALARANVPFDALPYDHDPTSTAYGSEAVAALGLSPDVVFKTLVVSLGIGAHAVAVVPVSREADLKAVAAVCGGKKAALATPRDVTRLTGYVLGGVSPVGQRTQLRTVIDASAQGLATMYVSGGRRGFDIGLSPADLARITDATFARIRR